jgi:hypothetical protein
MFAIINLNAVPQTQLIKTIIVLFIQNFIFLISVVPKILWEFDSEEDQKTYDGIVYKHTYINKCKFTNWKE